MKLRRYGTTIAILAALTAPASQAEDSRLEIGAPSASRLEIGAPSDSRAPSLDQRMVRIVDRTPFTDDAYRSVLQGLAFLPADVKQSFLKSGITIIITPSLERMGLEGKASEYSPKMHRVIICERESNGSRTDFRRMHITTLHELGHAFDQMMGYPSRSAEFHAIYNREAPTVPAEYYNRLSYFLQPGQNGPRECFASLFACRYYRGDDKRLTQLKASFPQTFQYVDSLHFK